MNTSVSVVITTFNKARYLEQAVESVFSQTFSQVECIVVDDGSTDDTSHVIAQLLRRYPALQSFSKPNGGVSSARNFGAQKASGEWIQFLDADDWLHPDKLRFQLSGLDNLHQQAVVYSDYERVYFNREEQVVKTQVQTVGHLSREHLIQRLLICPDFLADSPFPLLQQAMLLHKSLLARKQFDPRLKACEDREFVLELLLQGVPFVYAPLVGAYYRKHQANLTDNSALMRASYIDYFEIVCQHHADLKLHCQTSVQFLLKKSLEERDAISFSRLVGLVQFPVGLGGSLIRAHHPWALRAIYRVRALLPDFLLYERYRGPRSRKIFSALTSLLRGSKAVRSSSLN